MKIKGLFFIFFFLAGTLAFSAQDTKTMSLSADGIQTLRIDCGPGFLKVNGMADLDTIEVKAEIFVKGLDDRDLQEYARDHIKLSLERKGNNAVLISQIKDRSFFSFREARIDLTVTIPKNMDLNIDDGSGTTEIGNAEGNVTIDDGSGDIKVENIKGSLQIDDGSGGIDIHNITGDVLIDDGSGSITATNINGSIMVSDGSGSIDIRDVEKDVIIKDAGSGSEHISGVKGRVVIK